MSAADRAPVPANGEADGAPPGVRSLHLTAASRIRVRPVHWLWQNRVPLGALSLIAGREGIGKSTAAYDRAAKVTKGTLEGRYQGQPAAVLVAATEDSWEHTIVPRLMGAGADLDRVYRVEVTTSDGLPTGLILPKDLKAVERAAAQVGAAMILLDPLMSRLDEGLDTHKDADVRRALEPLVALADRSGCAVVGLIHVNKGRSGDPLTLVMGSRAFSAVARAVLFIMCDPDDENTRLLGQAKNNLGRTDLPTLTFTISTQHVAETDDGPVTTGVLRWTGTTDRSVTDALREGADGDMDTRSARQEAAGWLGDYLAQQGGSAPSKDVKAAGRAAGHSESALKRAASAMRVHSTAHGFPRTTWWSLPDVTPAVGSPPGESELTELTEPTGPTGTPVGPVGSVSAPSRAPEPTGTHPLTPEVPA